MSTYQTWSFKDRCPWLCVEYTHIHTHTHVRAHFRHTVTLSHYSSFDCPVCIMWHTCLSFWHNVGASRAGSPIHADGKRSQLELFPAGNPPQSTNGKLCMGVSFSLSLSLFGKQMNLSLSCSRAVVSTVALLRAVNAAHNYLKFLALYLITMFWEHDISYQNQ